MATKKKSLARKSTSRVVRQRATDSYLTDICMPNYTNSRGVMFGGKVLELLDKAAAIAAHRFCGTDAVTASMERVDFLTPIKQGYIIEYRARVIFTGRTSMTVKVTVHSEPTRGNKRTLCCIGFVNMIAIGPQGKPIPVPKLIVKGDEEREDYEEGKSLRLARQRCEI